MDRPIAARIADWAADVRWEDVPAEVRARAVLHVLDSVGVALASTRDPFAGVAAAAVCEDGPGTVIGMPQRLARRDAAFLNGILIHGLDFDDTHPPSVVHVSSSALPTALAVAEERQLSGRELLLGYLVAVEIAARVGMGARNGFHAKGFHPTGLVGAFGCSVAAARLSGLDGAGIARAQGVVGSFASGSMQFLDSGAWTKRLHPGWAASAGLMAARLAAAGWQAPIEVYEGRYGLYPSHTPNGHSTEPEIAVRGLGDAWEILAVAIKPFPACHYSHAFIDAALSLVRKHGLDAAQIEDILCLVPEEIVPVVCEPAPAKLTPRSDYDAKFSLPFIVAASIVNRRFTLAELEPAARADPRILELTPRVRYRHDPASTFPTHFCGEVVIRTRDGRELRHRESVNRGAAERPLPPQDIEDKFFENAGRVLDRPQAERVHEAVMTLATAPNAAAVAEVLRGGA